MKRTLRFFGVIAVFAGVLMLTSASNSNNFYVPVYMERAELERSVSYDPSPRTMADPGKIYTKGDMIFVNERYRGIHVIDNSDPSKPKKVGFLIAPGCIDMAAKGDILYFDNATDLVAFDMTSKAITKRIPNIFPEHGVPAGERYKTDKRPDNLILVRWKRYSEN